MVVQGYMDSLCTVLIFVYLEKHHRPPWIAKEAKIKTRELIIPQVSGIQVDILKYPVV